MACEAGDCALPVKAPLIEIKDHLNHLARGLLRRLVILLKRIDVTIIAPDSERAGHESHDRVELRSRHSLQDLNILIDLFGGLLMRG